MARIFVRQHSFCPVCKGGQCSCKACNNGVVSKLIPLDSLSPGLQREYRAAQADFVRAQEELIAEGRL